MARPRSRPPPETEETPEVPIAEATAVAVAAVALGPIANCGPFAVAVAAALPAFGAMLTDASNAAPVAEATTAEAFVNEPVATVAS